MYGRRWRKVRSVFLKANPLCVYCYKNGFVVTASVVDHIKPHKKDWKLFWDQANWQSLCTTCHQSVKQAEENNGRREIGYDGWPIDKGGEKKVK